MLRISGKRTLSKMNAFDFVVTVALGSTLATILLSSDVALAEGLAAFALLIFLQFAVTWLLVLSLRFPGTTYVSSKWGFYCPPQALLPAIRGESGPSHNDLLVAAGRTSRRRPAYGRRVQR